MLEEPHRVAGDEGAWALINTGGTPVDLRSPTDFAAGHIDGAINVPVDTLIGDPSGSLGSLEKTAVVVLYGTGDTDPKAYVAALLLEREGYSNVVYYRGGWADWTAAGR